MAFLFMGGIMQVTASVECFWEKNAAIRGVRASHWSFGDVDFQGLLSLYDSGHIINISDTNTSGALILDIDGPKPPSEKALAAMSPENREKARRKYAEALKIHREANIPKLLDPAYLDDIAAKLGAKSWELRDSSSRNPLKKKLFFEIEYPRNLLNNKDLEGKRLRELFERLTGIKSDDKMDTFTQLTFGCQITRLLRVDRSRWIPCGQPKKAPSAEKIRRSAPPAQTPDETPHAIPENEGNFKFIPLNMGAYNHIYGKSEREGGRIEWMVYRYTYGGKKELNVIPKGIRDTTLPRLYAAIIWNALFLNSARWQDLSGNVPRYTLRDCLTTLKNVIAFQFADGRAFWEISGRKACAQLITLWNGYASCDITEVYADLLKRTGLPRRERYVPKDRTAARLFHYYQDDLLRCRTYDEVKDMCGFISTGDARIYASLLRMCRKDGNIVKGRPGKKQTSISGYVQYLEKCPRDASGKYLVDAAHYHNGRFTNFCRTMNILIKKSNN